MPDVATITYIDHSRETASVTLNIPVVTAANLVATQAALVALVVAAGDIVRGLVQKRILTHKFPGSGAPAASEVAQRESKWLVGYTDVSTTLGAAPNPYFGKKFVTEFGAAELADHLSPNSDYADLEDGGEVEAFVTAFEAYVRSPAGGAVTVSYIKLVGRST